MIVLIALIAGVHWILDALSTVSTDDAYVNGHVTFVAPRVPGQVMRVLVDDNNRVHKGDLLVQLDKEPYQVQVNIAQAAVDAAQADLVAASAQVRGIEGQTRSLRFSLEHAIEDVDNQIALLRSKVATLDSKNAALTQGAGRLRSSGAADQIRRGLEGGTRHAARKPCWWRRAEVEEALQGVYQVRVALGLPPKPANRRRPDRRCRLIWIKPSPRSGRPRRR